ncbi:MAG: hypothetical protein ACRETZ_07790 [Steroidobacteraceae bacterium]
MINAGGIISVAHEYRGGATAAQVRAQIEKIPTRLTEIFERARREGRPTSAVADETARERLARGEPVLSARTHDESLLRRAPAQDAWAGGWRRHGRPLAPPRSEPTASHDVHSPP